MKKVVIFGTGDLAQVAHFYLTHDSPYEIVAFTANRDYIKEDRVFNLPLVPFEEIEEKYPPNKFSMFIAIGYKGVNKLRARIYMKAKEKGYELISYINSKVIKWEDMEIGDNCFIFENQVIQPFVKIGSDVIIWSGNHIGHHSIIGDHCFITSHVVISGNVKIGPYCFIGINATLRDGITIGRECVIGAGSLILRDTKEREVYTAKSAELRSIDSSKLRDI
jgi:sugar O-acyltransferase (sialic acid O-acetyltransferase NeuD family)